MTGEQRRKQGLLKISYKRLQGLIKKPKPLEK
jgi:hypothetical protein